MVPLVGCDRWPGAGDGAAEYEVVSPDLDSLEPKSALWCPSCTIWFKLDWLLFTSARKGVEEDSNPPAYICSGKGTDPFESRVLVLLSLVGGRDLFMYICSHEYGDLGDALEVSFSLVEGVGGRTP